MMQAGRLTAVATLVYASALIWTAPVLGSSPVSAVYAVGNPDDPDDSLDGHLAEVLLAAGFTGDIEHAFRHAWRRILADR